jgi:hypothetical protein
VFFIKHDSDHELSQTADILILELPDLPYATAFFKQKKVTSEHILELQARHRHNIPISYVHRSPKFDSTAALLPPVAPPQSHPGRLCGSGDPGLFFFPSDGGPTIAAPNMEVSIMGVPKNELFIN